MLDKCLISWIIQPFVISNEYVITYYTRVPIWRITIISLLSAWMMNFFLNPLGSSRFVSQIPS